MTKKKILLVVGCWYIHFIQNETIKLKFQQKIHIKNVLKNLSGYVSKHMLYGVYGKKQ